MIGRSLARMMDEGRCRFLGVGRQGDPCLNAEQVEALARAVPVAVRSEWEMPLPAVIQLTAPGRIGCTVPKLSRCMISPSNR